MQTDAVRRTTAHDLRLRFGRMTESPFTAIATSEMSDSENPLARQSIFHVRVEKW